MRKFLICFLCANIMTSGFLQTSAMSGGRKFLDACAKKSAAASKDWENVKTIAVVPSGIVSDVFAVFEKGYEFVRWVIDKGGDVYAISAYNGAIKDFEKLKIEHGGFKKSSEIREGLFDIINGKSRIKVLGQGEAKGKIFSALSPFIEKISGTTRYGNKGQIIYILGPSGTGKTVMARAIADALLKNSELSCITIGSDMIDPDAVLGEQIFRTASVRNVPIPRTGTEKVTFGSLFKENVKIDGGKVYFKEEDDGEGKTLASPVLQHIRKWGDVGAVVILDEYDKMKGMREGFGDVSSDEVLRRIVDYGYYLVGNGGIVDCSKTLFIITSNETKADLIESFGGGGAKGGAFNRLKVIEFNNLDMGACAKLVEEFLIDKFKNETKSNYYVKDIVFADNVINDLARYVFNSKDDEEAEAPGKQARAIEDIRDALSALRFRNFEEITRRRIRIGYTASEEERKLGEFSYEVVN